MRTSEGVYLVELEQLVTGTRVRLDGRVVARASAWRFPAEPFQLAIGGERASLGLVPDAAAGTLRTTLIVAGARVPPDAPPQPAPQAGLPWRTWLGRSALIAATLLVSAAVLGDPYGGWVAGALKTGLDVAWLAALRGVDPAGLLPGWLAAITTSRPAMLLLGLELAGAVWIARDERLRSRLPHPAGRAVRAAAWSLLAVGAALAPLLLAG